MNNYKKNQLENFSSFHFSFINVEEMNNVFKITLNRPDKKNALHPQMINEIAFAMHYAHFNSSVWIVLFEAKGSVFCAGADLKAMSGDIEPNNSSIPLPKYPVIIGDLFRKIHKPTIACVRENVYAGGFLILAGCLFVIADNKLNFSLPEVKRGLFPFQVMASLTKVMPERKVLNWCILGNSITAKEAFDLGLITHLTDGNDFDITVNLLVEEIKLNSPAAIKLGLEAYETISNNNNNHEYLHSMLNKIIESKQAKEGLEAFNQKRKPNWLNN